MATQGVTLRGKSLVHSVRLTSEAFKRSFFGDYGQYAVTVGLVLFAFSTAVAWSYYGDRAITYLFGTPMGHAIPCPLRDRVLPRDGPRHLAAVWLVSAVTLALMALPNLLGIVLLAGEMKSTVRDYWAGSLAAPQPDEACVVGDGLAPSRSRRRCLAIRPTPARWRNPGDRKGRPYEDPPDRRGAPSGTGLPRPGVGADVSRSGRRPPVAKSGRPQGSALREALAL